MPDAPPIADPLDAAEQMRVATDRLRDQAWKVIQDPAAEQGADSSNGTE